MKFDFDLYLNKHSLDVLWSSTLGATKNAVDIILERIKMKM